MLYEVTSTTGMAVTVIYWSAGHLQWEERVPMPWSKTVNQQGSQVTSVGAQVAGTGTITCRISIDGAVVTERSATGELANVYCQL